MYVLGSKLNRSYTLNLAFDEEYAHINILFNKNNSFVGLNLDQHTYIKYRHGEIKNTIFTNIAKSGFATTFLDIRNFQSKNLDIKHQFHNIRPKYSDMIHYETNETIKLSKIKTQRGSFESCLYVYIFRITDFGNDFLYCLVERQHIDSVLDKKIVRTFGLQLATLKCYEDLTSHIENGNKNIVDKQNVQDAMTESFS